jgi:hypothetical protein
VLYVEIVEEVGRTGCVRRLARWKELAIRRLSFTLLAPVAFGEESDSIDDEPWFRLTRHT